MKNTAQFIALLLSLLVVSLPVIFAEEFKLTYDGNGNLVTGDSFYREYNELSQLVRVREGNVSSGDILQEYTWHPIYEKILIKDVFENGVFNYSVYYVNENYVVIENSSGNYTEKYIYQDGTLVAQVNTDGEKEFVHSDHLGSTSLITDIDGNVVEDNFYSPFGEEIEKGSSRFGYEGKEFDEKTQDTDFHFRKYRPDWGRFTQPDDIVEKYYDPQFLNRYAFERNNPYRYRDPTGHVLWDIVDIAFFASDVNDFRNDPGIKTGAFLAISTVSLFPVLPNFVAYAKQGSKVVKQANNAEKATDVIKAADKAKEVTKSSKFVNLKNPFAFNRLGKDVKIQTRKLQHIFDRHKGQFNLEGKFSDNADKLFSKLQGIIHGKKTRVIKGTYRGTIKGTHYYDPSSKLWVFVDKGGEAVASFKLGERQLYTLGVAKNVS